MDGSWRKRVGVEPTKSRLATLTGFEVRPPHRERVPSKIILGGLRSPEQVEAVGPHVAEIAAADCDAVAVEELEHLDRDLAAVFDLVAERRGVEGTVGAGLRE